MARPSPINEFAKSLMGDFPLAMPEMPYCGVACPKGWETIVRNCMSEINEYLKLRPVDGFKVSQIKEKWRFLCVYYNPHVKEVDEIISRAEAECKRVCLRCGEPGIRDEQSYKTLCERCINNASQ